MKISSEVPYESKRSGSSVNQNFLNSCILLHMCVRFDTADRQVLLIAAATTRPHGDHFHTSFVEIICFCKRGAGHPVSFEVLLRVIIELGKFIIPLASVQDPCLKVSPC